MKTTTEKHFEPASEYETTTYTCEEPGCDFETTDEEEAKLHPGQHAVKEERYVGGLTLYRFASDADLKAHYHHQRNQDHHGWGVDEPEYAGPGWYAYTLRDVPCRCGGCGFKNEGLRPLAWWIEERGRAIEQHKEKVKALEAEVAALAALAKE